MRDKITPQGTVEYEVIKADGTVSKNGGGNAISSELKNTMASSLRAATDTYGMQVGDFLTDDSFNSSIPNTKNGIIIKDNQGTKYQMTCTALDMTSDYKIKVKGVARNNTGSTIVITDAYMGHDTSSSQFNIQYSSFDFSVAGDPADDVDVADGDQLNITWEITIADDGV